jgi:hypothetical protein
MELERRQRARYAVLREIYNRSGVDRAAYFSAQQISDAIPLGIQEVEAALDYLAGEGLIQDFSTGAEAVAITHEGIVEFEKSLQAPQEPTEHFPTTVIQHFHGAVGVVQTGNHNTANVIQRISATDAELARILTAIESTSRHQPEEKRVEIDAHLADIREEMAKPGPERKPLRLKAYALALWATTRDAAIVAAAVAELLRFFNISP